MKNKDDLKGKKQAEEGCKCGAEQCDCDAATCDCVSSEKVLTKEEEDYKTQLQRLQAEFDNYRRRTDDEKIALKSLYVGNFVERIIPVLDHFELALKHECADKNYSMGIEMIFNSLNDVLKNEGITPIDVLGKEFDATCAEAVGTRFEDGKTENVVLEVQTKGYILKDKVLRRARVIVNKADNSEGSE